MTVRYYHGGQRGLRVGEFILPPAITKVRCTSDLVPNRVHRRDRVYVATNMTGAAMYAAVHASPTVYEVQPEGQIEGDPDCDDPGLSFACERARIVAVYKVPGKVIKKARKALLSPSPF